MTSENGVLSKFIVKDFSKKIDRISIRNLWQEIGHIVHENFDELVVLECKSLKLIQVYLLSAETFEKGVMHRFMV